LVASLEWPQTSGQGLTLVGDWDTVKINGTAQARTHGAAHELTAIGASSLSLDVKGNITQDTTKTNTHNYTWDFDNRMSFADVDGTAGDEIEYAYDALGRRVSKTFPVGENTQTNVFVCRTQPLDESRFAGQVLAEYLANSAASTPMCKFVYGQYIDEPLLMVKVEVSKEEEEKELVAALTITETKYYYHTNRLYSVTAMTNQAAAVVERYAYAAYGALTILAPNGTTVRAASAINNPYIHTGRRHDEETGLYHYRARYYDAELGRFLGRDPIGYQAGPSLYRAYFVPNGVDPTGLIMPPFVRRMICGTMAHGVIGRAIQNANRQYQTFISREVNTIIRATRNGDVSINKAQRAIKGRDPGITALISKPDIVLYRPPRQPCGEAQVYEIKPDTWSTGSAQTQLAGYIAALQPHIAYTFVGDGSHNGLNNTGSVPTMGCGDIRWWYEGAGVIRYEWLSNEPDPIHEPIRIPVPEKPDWLNEPGLERDPIWVKLFLGVLTAPKAIGAAVDAFSGPGAVEPAANPPAGTPAPAKQPNPPVKRRQYKPEQAPGGVAPGIAA
jgi:RHS repeat-associated protein